MRSGARRREHNECSAARVGLYVSCRGNIGKRRFPCPIKCHALARSTGNWGPWCSALALWLCLEAKPERALGPGATVGILGTGVPRLACLRPTSVAPSTARYGPASAATTQDPREGPSLARRMTQDLLGGGLTRLAREGGEIKARGTSRGPCDASHDD